MKGKFSYQKQHAVLSQDSHQETDVPGKGVFAWVSQLFITVTNTLRQLTSMKGACLGSRFGKYVQIHIHHVALGPVVRQYIMGEQSCSPHS